MSVGDGLCHPPGTVGTQAREFGAAQGSTLEGGKYNGVGKWWTEHRRLHGPALVGIADENRSGAPARWDSEVHCRDVPGRSATKGSADRATELGHPPPRPVLSWT